ncbi:MAG: hypothetical protein AAGP08_03340, partial [Pseudomonadota bacterium]
LYGIWGTDAQCSEALLLPTGTKRAAPFDIRPGWLRHGQMWCRLSWFDTDTRETGLFVGAVARCGEDSVRSYRLDFALDSGTLHLIWDQTLVNGPLALCPTS